MTFKPAIAEQQFVLDNVVRLSEINAEAADVTDAVLQGVGELAAGDWAPLDRAGDAIGARLTEIGVVLSAGFPPAYSAYVQGGWGTIGAPEEFGGQGLPVSLSAAVLETLGTANMAFALAPTLTGAAVKALVHHRSPDQQAAYLPKLATGEWTGTMNLTEPQAGSDVGALSQGRGTGQVRVPLRDRRGRAGAICRRVN